MFDIYYTSGVGTPKAFTDCWYNSAKDRGTMLPAASLINSVFSEIIMTPKSASNLKYFLPEISEAEGRFGTDRKYTVSVPSGSFMIVI